MARPDSRNGVARVTDEERREVAARLRELPSDTYAASKEWEREGLFIDASIGDEADYSQIHNAILGCFPAEHMHPGDYEELHERLADLIDRPTCKNLATKSADELLCRECGEHVDIAYMENADDYPARYYPNCGAEVVE